jgi:hypothetical protein
MGKSRGLLRALFSPPYEAKRWVRSLPYLTPCAPSILLFIGEAHARDYAISPSFFGTNCHTRPPENTAGMVSSHAQVDCGACHGDNGMHSLNLTTYQTELEGGEKRPAIMHGDLRKRPTPDQAHRGAATLPPAEGRLIQYAQPVDRRQGALGNDGAPAYPF